MAGYRGFEWDARNSVSPEPESCRAAVHPHVVFEPVNASVAGSESPVASVFPTVPSIVPAVFPAVATSADAVRDDRGRPDGCRGSGHWCSENSCSPHPCSSQHVQASCSSVSDSSAPIRSWIGIRPLATNWPPERRTADANGAAQRFS